MRKRWKMAIGSALALVLLVGLSQWARSYCLAPMPEPSLPGGYYAEPFLLKLDAPKNGTIYYTLDGSAPTLQSPKYDGEGVPIANRSGEENLYTSIPNVVVDWRSYTPDPTPVEKGTVLRAMFVSDLGLSSEILTETYFVGIPAPEQGYTLSLIFEYEDLFGENGIYVTGKEYDDWYLGGQKTLPPPEPNFEKRIEIGAILQVLDPSGEVLTQPIGARIQGNSMRGWHKKRFTFEAQEERSGINVFAAALFPGVSTHSVMTKDSATDAMMAELYADRAAAVQKSAKAKVFLNGEYWYDTYILERYDKQYFRQHFGVDDVMLVKNGEVDPNHDPSLYWDYMDWVGHTDFTEEAQWAQVKEETDIQSFIDYIVINYYLCNWDMFEDKNYLTWRSVREENSPYADTRWRWCVYDIDATPLTSVHYDLETIAQLNTFTCDLPYSDGRMEEMTLFRAFRDVEEFRQQFVTSFMDIVNNNFAPKRVETILEKHGLTLDWENGFFRERPGYAAEHLAEEFQLTGTLETVNISTADPSRGTVQVNTSRIDLSEGAWSGQYFTDYPITITARANAGYQFAGWKGGSDEMADTITLPVDGGLTLEAVFVEGK